MSKDFEAIIAGKARSVQLLTKEDREKLRAAYGPSFALSVAARYEATIEFLEKILGIFGEEKDAGKQSGA